MALIQDYHQLRENERPTLQLTVYFEVIPLQAGVHSREHHMFFRPLTNLYFPGVIRYKVGTLSNSTYNVSANSWCNRCRYETALTSETLQLMRKRYPILSAHTSQGFSILGFMGVYENVAFLSDYIVYPELAIVTSTDEDVRRRLQGIMPDDHNLANQYSKTHRSLITRPHNLPRPLYGKLIHTSESGPSLVEVRVWTIHGQQFMNGRLQFEQLFVEIQRENCPIGDTVVIYDGPPAGMLTSYGLTSPFGVLFDGPCTNITGVVNSSLGDITISWIHRNPQGRVVGFAYKQQPVFCSQIPCTYTNVSVGYQEKILTFEQTDSPTFQVFRFEAVNDGNVNLMFHIHVADFSHSMDGFMYSAMWLFEDSLRGVFCTQTNLMLLNSSIAQKKGVQFNRVAELVIKAYPQNARIKFRISFVTTNCFGLLNPCIFADIARTQSNRTCFPQISDIGTVFITGTQARDCCFVLTYLENSLIKPSTCVLGLWHESPGSHLIRVDHTEFTPPFKLSCCNHLHLTAELQIGSDVHDFREGCRYARNNLKNQTFQTTHFRLKVIRHLNPGSCSSITAVAGEQSSLCVDLDLPSNVLREYIDFDKHLSLSYPCINTGSLFYPYVIIQITASYISHNFHMEYYLKMNGNIDIRKLHFLSGETKDDWEWGLFLQGLHNEFLRFTDSHKIRYMDIKEDGIMKVLTAASLRLESQFILQFRMKKTHPIHSKTFYTMPGMQSGLCPGSSYMLLSRCYRKLAVADSMSWLEASRACTDLGMNMLSLNSEQEWLALAAFLFEEEHDIATVFLGLRRENVSDSISSQ